MCTSVRRPQDDIMKKMKVSIYIQEAWKTQRTYIASLSKLLRSRNHSAAVETRSVYVGKSRIYSDLVTRLIDQHNLYD